MPIVLGPLLVGFGVIVVALVHYGLQAGARGWLAPLLRGMPAKNSFGGWWIRHGPIGQGVRAVKWLYHHTTKAIGDALGLSLTPLVHWLSALGTLVEMRTSQVVGVAEDTVKALSWLRHHAVPALIHAAVAPVHALAREASHAAHAADAYAHAAERRLLRGIDRLEHRLTSRFAREFHGIDAFVRSTVWPRARAAERAVAGVIAHDLPALRRRERALERRLSRVEKALGLGIIGALLYRVLARVAPWLFCRNWKRLGPRVCGINPSYIDDVFALLLTAETIANLPTLVKIMQGVTRETAEGIKELSGV